MADDIEDLASLLQPLTDSHSNDPNSPTTPDDSIPHVTVQAAAIRRRRHRQPPPASSPSSAARRTFPAPFGTRSPSPPSSPRTTASTEGTGLLSLFDPAVRASDAGTVVSSSPCASSPSPSSSAAALQAAEETLLGDPGQYRVYVRTWGCAHNNSDSEYMAGQLAAYGFDVVTDAALRESADVWLLNGCTVKSPSQMTFLNAVRECDEAGRKVVLAGCVSQGDPRHQGWSSHSIVGVQQIDRVVEVVEETLRGRSVRLLGAKRDGGARLHLPKIRKNPLIEIIPINTGCLNQCTYCKTKHARGDLRSYAPEEIWERVRSVIEEGVVEIWLTSEDLGTYGRDIGSSLPKLLWGIVELLPEHVMLRCGMTNPPYILEHIDEMAKILSHPQVYAFLHIPVQAASDSVLEAMRRQYTCAEFCHVVDALHAQVDGDMLTIATDIICGFPTETAEQFEETLALVRKYKFPVLNISQFYPRPGTPAARMKRLPTQEVKSRSRAMTALFNSYRTRDHLLGRRMRVLVTEVATDRVHYVAHNKAYDQVLVPMRPELMGKMFDVRITEVGKFHMMGEPVDDEADEQAEQQLGAGDVSSFQMERAPFFPSEESQEMRARLRRQRKGGKQKQAAEPPTRRRARVCGQTRTRAQLAVDVALVLATLIVALGLYLRLS